MVQKLVGVFGNAFWLGLCGEKWELICGNFRDTGNTENVLPQSKGFPVKYFCHKTMNSPGKVFWGSIFRVLGTFLTWMVQAHSNLLFSSESRFTNTLSFLRITHIRVLLLTRTLWRTIFAVPKWITRVFTVITTVTGHADHMPVHRVTFLTDLRRFETALVNTTLSIKSLRAWDIAFVSIPTLGACASTVDAIAHTVFTGTSVEIKRNSISFILSQNYVNYKSFRWQKVEIDKKKKT